MLSIFPTLLSYQQFSPVIIRITLGAVLIFWAYQGLREPLSPRTKKVGNVIEAIIGALLIIGLYTQIAAGLAALGLAIGIIRKIRDRAFLTHGINYLLILLVLAISLMVTGAGWWAFDLPL